MQEQNFSEGLEKILAQEQRYHRDAYIFVREALDFTQKVVSKNNKNAVRHVTGQELLRGIRDFGLSQYGPMTLAVLAEWGVQRCEDFGEIVFAMVESGLLSKTETDSRADFAGGYDFEKAFREPFRPAGQTRPPMSPENQPT